MLNFKPKDVIALLTLLVIILVKLKGVNGTLDAAFGLILGYYFAHRTSGTDKGV